MKFFNIKKCLKCVVFFSLLSVIIFLTANLVKKKDSYYNKDPFFSTEANYDVLFFGSSHMHEGIDPIYLWKNYGISSYNLGSSGESIQMTYYVIKAALEHSHPKAIVVDSFKIDDNPNDIDEGYAFVHESIDALPFNENKLEAINYAGKFFDGGKMAFLSNLYAYHGRISELEKKDFKKSWNYDKGAYILTSICNVETVDPASYIEDTTEFNDGDGIVFYKKIVELCKEKNVKLILVNIPANIENYTEKRQKKTNTLMKYTVDNGGMAINFLPLLDKIGIDYSTDFGDATHLNELGAAKTADYLADYLKTNLEIPDRRSDENYAARWNSDIEKWYAQQIEMLAEKKDAISYLFLAFNEDRDIKVSMVDPSAASQMYGLEFCLNKIGVIPEQVNKHDIGDFDMKIEIRNKSDNTWLASQYFYQNEGGNFYIADK